VVAAKKLADANRIIQDFGIDDIQVLNGRYGPYITDKNRNARIPKDRDPKTLTLEECRALLEAAPPRPGRGRFGRGAKSGTKSGAKSGGKSATKTGPKAGAKTTAEDGTEAAATKASPAKKKAPAKKKTAAKKKSAPRKKTAAAKAPSGDDPAG
jgi:DNA topoisomerase-1